MNSTSGGPVAPNATAEVWSQSAPAPSSADIWLSTTLSTSFVNITGPQIILKNFLLWVIAKFTLNFRLYMKNLCRKSHVKLAKHHELLQIPTVTLAMIIGFIFNIQTETWFRLRSQTTCKLKIIIFIKQITLQLKTIRHVKKIPKPVLYM